MFCGFSVGAQSIGGLLGRAAFDPAVWAGARYSRQAGVAPLLLVPILGAAAAEIGLGSSRSRGAQMKRAQFARIHQTKALVCAPATQVRHS